MRDTSKDDGLPSWGIALFAWLGLVTLLIVLTIACAPFYCKQKSALCSAEKKSVSTKSSVPPPPAAQPPARSLPTADPMASEPPPPPDAPSGQASHTDAALAPVLLPPGAFAPGEAVEVDYGAARHGATIVELQANGLYTVDWDDGSYSIDVPPESLWRVKYPP